MRRSGVRFPSAPPPANLVSFATSPFRCRTGSGASSNASRCRSSIRLSTRASMTRRRKVPRNRSLLRCGRIPPRNPEVGSDRAAEASSLRLQDVLTRLLFGQERITTFDRRYDATPLFVGVALPVREPHGGAAQQRE